MSGPNAQRLRLEPDGELVVDDLGASEDELNAEHKTVQGLLVDVPVHRPAQPVDRRQGKLL